MRIYSIGELAKLAGVSIRTLRYYDKIGLLKPAERADHDYKYLEYLMSALGVETHYLINIIFLVKAIPEASCKR